MARVFNGQVTNLGLGGSGGVTGMFRTLLSGSLDLNTNDIEEQGAGGQIWTGKGITEATLKFSCIGPDITNAALFFPTTAAVQIENFPGFYVEANDGINYLNWAMTLCQPAAAQVASAGGKGSAVKWEFTVKAALGEALEAQPESCTFVNELLGHGSPQVAVSYGNAALGTIGWTLSSDLGTDFHNPQDAKETGALTWPDGCVLGNRKESFEATVSDPARTEIAYVGVDAWPIEDITIALKNGTSDEDVIIRLLQWQAGGPTGVPLESGAVQAYKLSAKPATGFFYGRVTLAAT